MCGIAGILNSRGPVDRDVLARMTNSLRHRGPDDEEYHLETPAPGRLAVGLGFRRLAIIDLGAGRQPMANEDESLWIVCNGEIYNHQDLRSELEARGHRFRTHCDIETLLHLYEESGPDCLQKVNGMFAAAIWDTRDQRLFLARDRLGKKPLYYRHTPSQFLFGSEVKALLQHPDCPPELDRVSLAKYLAYEYVPSPHCIFKGIQKLPAGHHLTWKNGQTTVRQYWDLSFPPVANSRPEGEIADELLARLREAVRLRLISDVPLGVFLSGGIDSSSVVAMMAELRPASQIKTFAIGFEERSFDESHHARLVARHFGTDHHEDILKSQTLVDILPEVADFLDEPFADASIIPTYLLSRFTRRHVTVALGGDGGDELLAGYPTFQADRVARWYRRLPSALHKGLAQRLTGLLPVSHKNFSFDFKVKQFLRGVSYEPGIRNQVWLGSFTPDEQQNLLRADSGGADVYDDIRAAEGRCEAKAALNRLVYLYCKFYLQDDILFKVDRASMACGLEARAPFLDYTLVDFLCTIPPRLKLRGLTAKYILKRALKGRLPADILGRGKKGFGIPIAKWFRGELRELLQDTLSESRLKRQGLFNPTAVSALIAQHLQGKKDNRKQLWTLFMFQLWHEKYLRAQ